MIIFDGTRPLDLSLISDRTPVQDDSEYMPGTGGSGFRRKHRVGGIRSDVMPNCGICFKNDDQDSMATCSSCALKVR